MALVAVAKDRSRGPGPTTDELVRAILRALSEAREDVSEDELLAALMANDATAIVGTAWDDTWRKVNAKIREATTKVLQRAGAAEVARLRLNLSFDLDNPYAIRYAREQSAELVQLGAEAKAAIREIVGQGFVDGIPPRQMARSIRPLIGLTERDARAVRNRMDKLAETDLPPDRIQRLTEDYSGKLLRARADSIARTETLDAENAGAHAAWYTARDKGLIAPDAKRRWIAAPGSERTCDLCGELHNVEVGLDETWTNPQTGEAVERPPLHPRCRCSTALITKIPGRESA